MMKRKDCFEERRAALLLELESLQGEGALYGFLMKQGGSLPFFAEEWMTDACLLRGCQYRVWLHLELEDGLVRIHADTVMMSGDDLLRFADRGELVFWGSGSVEQRIYGCLYAVKGYAARRLREYVRGLDLLPDAPEDMVIGSSVFDLYPEEKRHVICPPFGPDDPDSGWTAYY